eukprot:GFYU01003309.1.p1 GENE.GFYU01003309.1~~GFYU01003309.1.p1  ORF type:complete len:792 (+),score=236.36 GFYU01003309.1:146-2521(+)
MVLSRRTSAQSTGDSSFVERGEKQPLRGDKPVAKKSSSVTTLALATLAVVAIVGLVAFPDLPSRLLNTTSPDAVSMTCAHWAGDQSNTIYPCCWEAGNYCQNGDYLGDNVNPGEAAVRSAVPCVTCGGAAPAPAPVTPPSPSQVSTTCSYDDGTTVTNNVPCCWEASTATTDYCLDTSTMNTCIPCGPPSPVPVDQVDEDCTFNGQGGKKCCWQANTATTSYCLDVVTEECVVCNTDPVPSPKPKPVVETLLECPHWTHLEAVGGDASLLPPGQESGSPCCWEITGDWCQSHSPDVDTCQPCGSSVDPSTPDVCPHYNHVVCPGNNYVCCDGVNVCQNADGTACVPCSDFNGAGGCYHWDPDMFSQGPNFPCCDSLNNECQDYDETTQQWVCNPCTGIAPGNPHAPPGPGGPTGPTGPNNQNAECELKSGSFKWNELAGLPQCDRIEFDTPFATVANVHCVFSVNHGKDGDTTNDVKHHASFVWAEEIDNDGFRVCFDEMDFHDAWHESQRTRLHYLCYQQAPSWAIAGRADFASNGAGSVADGECLDVSFPDPSFPGASLHFASEPVILYSINHHAYTAGGIHDSIIAYGKKVYSQVGGSSYVSGFRVCVSEVGFDSIHDRTHLSIDWLAFSSEAVDTPLVASHASTVNKFKIQNNHAHCDTLHWSAPVVITDDHYFVTSSWFSGLPDSGNVGGNFRTWVSWSETTDGNSLLVCHAEEVNNPPVRPAGDFVVDAVAIMQECPGTPDCGIPGPPPPPPGSQAPPLPLCLFVNPGFVPFMNDQCMCSAINQP